MKLIDTHCHLDDPAYSKDRQKVIDEAKKDLAAAITSAVEPKDFALTIRLVKENPGFVYSNFALHPGLIKKFSEKDQTQTLEFIKKNRNQIIGVGETGLDYNWVKDEPNREKQCRFFICFIKLAKELDLPLLVHIRAGEDKIERNPYQDALEILEKERAPRVQLHMFGAKKFLERVLKNGWYISTNAIVQTSKEHKKIIQRIPLERLLLETDAPYLVPEPEKSKGVNRNEPKFILRVARTVAELRDEKLTDVIQTTSKNSRKLYRI